MTKLLRVTAPHFVAGAVWQRIGDAWMCVRTAPILAWMAGKPWPDVRQKIARVRWFHEWL